ncbi:hypothetical protein HA402_002550 [Bradysia odoriphaga]|nr:hypothetical protein HA402_002550 [Bradysia odoriphaga]
MIVPKSFVILILLLNSLMCSNASNRIESAISQATKLIELLRIQAKVPCVSVGVSYRGEEIWTDGFGFANLESGTSCTSRSLHRIGSITKPVSMLLLGKLLEENRLDLDRTIYDYLGEKFPRKTFNGNEVNITLRQLVSHMGGIRHYLSDTEFYQKVGCDSIYESLNYFKDDPLIAAPGTEYHYSSFGYVTVGAVLQSVLNENETFESEMLNILRNQLGMRETYFDEVSKILLNRISYYQLNEGNQLEIAPFVDESCRWPGGGLLSNVHDLLKFGNVMIDSNKTENGFLTKATVDRLWDKVVPIGATDLLNTFYGMGWQLLERKSTNCSDCETVPFSYAVGHSGGSSGAIAYLVIVPEEDMVVSLLTNVSPVPPLLQVGIDIMSTFIEFVNQADYSREGEGSHGNTMSTNSKKITLFVLTIFFIGNLLRDF